MADLDRSSAVDRLQSVPLEEFVAERTRISRELRAGGDRPAAAEIAKLPKPSAAAWALNHVAREAPEAVADWVEAVEALRSASVGGGDRLRGAMVEHRSATQRLLAVLRERAQPAGRPLSEAMLDRVRTLLQAATTDPEVGEELQAGRISDDRATADAGWTVSDDVPEAPRPRRASKSNAKKAKRAPKPDPEAEALAERRAELERRVQAITNDLDHLRREADRRTMAARSADERLEEARRALSRLQSEAAAAQEAVSESDRSVSAAERELEELRALE